MKVAERRGREGSEGRGEEGREGRLEDDVYNKDAVV